MQEAIARLKQLQQRMERRAYSSLLDTVIEKLYFMEVQGLLHVEFYGNPFEHYQQLFRSQAFARVGMFVLWNAILSAEQLAELRALNQKVQFLIIQTESQYVR